VARLQARWGQPPVEGESMHNASDRFSGSLPLARAALILVIRPRGAGFRVPGFGACAAPRAHGGAAARSFSVRSIGVQPLGAACVVSIADFCARPPQAGFRVPGFRACAAPRAHSGAAARSFSTRSIGVQPLDAACVVSITIFWCSTCAPSA
jgi:hypothetical protein